MQVVIVIVETVALRKESVDRNILSTTLLIMPMVALRKESVDRNHTMQVVIVIVETSLSARRAWIEIASGTLSDTSDVTSLSARRAWIEITARRNVIG